MHYVTIYISRAAITFTDEILQELTAKSAQNNQHDGITGVLLLNGNYFLQMLEGREDKVKALYKKIAQDDRHTEARVIAEGLQEQQLFENWCMRGYDLDDYYDVDMGQLKREILHVIDGNITGIKDIVAILKNFKNLVAATDTTRQNKSASYA